MLIHIQIINYHFMGATNTKPTKFQLSTKKCDMLSQFSDKTNVLTIDKTDTLTSDKTNALTSYKTNVLTSDKTDALAIFDLNTTISFW